MIQSISHHMRLKSLQAQGSQQNITQAQKKCSKEREGDISKILMIINNTIKNNEDTMHKQKRQRVEKVMALFNQNCVFMYETDRQRNTNKLESSAHQLRKGVLLCRIWKIRTHQRTLLSYYFLCVCSVLMYAAAAHPAILNPQL